LSFPSRYVRFNRIVARQLFARDLAHTVAFYSHDVLSPGAFQLNFDVGNDVNLREEDAFVRSWPPYFLFQQFKIDGFYQSLCFIASP